MQDPNTSPEDFINKSYAESTLYEINDALAVLAKSVSKMQQENKELISSHFSKFVQCRSVLEDIWADIKSKGLDKSLTSRIERNLGIIMAKYNDITKDIAGDIAEEASDNRRAYYESEFAVIFSMKEDLKKSLNVFESFANVYQRAKKAFLRVQHSRFMKAKFEEIQPEVRAFLENVYRAISAEGISFEDACYHFDLYFSVSGGKTDRKIMNTLLVNFKETTHGGRESSVEYTEYMFASLGRLVKYVDDDIAAEGIRHFMDCMRSVLEDTSPMYAKITLKRMHEAKNALGMSASCMKEYANGLSDLKQSIFRSLVAGKEIAQVVEAYDEFVDILEEDERGHIQDAMLDFAMRFIEERRYDSYEYLRSEAVEIRQLRPCLGSSGSKRNRKLDAFLGKYRGEIIEKLSHAFSEVAEAGDDVCTLMEAAKIISRTSEFYWEILFEAKHSILKRPVVYHYLARLIKMEAPVLSEKEASETKALEYQFSFLLEISNSQAKHD